MPVEVIRVVELKRKRRVSISSSSMYQAMADGLGSEGRRRLAGIEQRLRLSINTNSDMVAADPLIRGFNEFIFECLSGSIRYLYEDKRVVLLEFTLTRTAGGGSARDGKTRPTKRVAGVPRRHFQSRITALRA